MSGEVINVDADGIPLEFPVGTSPQIIQATVKKVLASRTPTEQPRARTSAPVELSTMDRALAKLPDIPQPIVDVAAGMSGLMRGGANLVSEGLGEKIWPKGVSTDSGWRLAGQLADPAAFAIAGGIGKALPYVPVLGQGISGAAKALTQNALTGAAMGGAIGGLSDEGTIGTGGAVGAAANVVLPPIANVAARGAGRAVDFLAGKAGPVQAANILRETAGENLPAIRAATAASPNLTAAQAAEGVGSDAWSALGNLAQQKRSQFFTDLLERQKQERIDAMRKLARGATQTEVIASADASKRALNTITTPMRETELAAANAAGTTGTRLQAEADRLGEAASSHVADVRRLEAAKQAALGNAAQPNLTIGTPTTSEAQVAAGMPRLGEQIGRYGYGTELAGTAERASQTAADSSLALGEAARFAQRQADSLAAHGLKPLDTSRIVGNIMSKLNDPAIGVDPINKKVLTNVAQTISEWTAKGGGVIDAEALYAIRKSAINSEVMKQLGTADPKANAKLAAKLLAEIKPSIDSAIEKAGGTGWKNYLKTFEEGMHQIDQQKMAGKAMGLLETQPKKFESLVSGNEPKIVRKVFETEYDIAKSMGDKIIPMQKAAEELARDRRITEGAVRGSGELMDILYKNVAKWKLPNWINAKIAVTNRALMELEKSINESTMNAIYSAMRSGRNASDLLKVIPAKDRIPVIKALMTQRATPYASALAANVATASEVEN